MTTALNRLTYDACAYQKALSESVAPIDYMLDIVKFEHCGKCRNELGLLGGTAVSHVTGDLVALENDLFNITRPSTRCPAYHYRPIAPGDPVTTQIDMSIPGRVPNPEISTQQLHLRPCQMVSYPSVPQPPQTPPFSCASAGADYSGPAARYYQ
jgi:hypothetical protein